MLAGGFHRSHGQTCSVFSRRSGFLHGSLEDARQRTPCYLACRHATAAYVTSTGRATRRVSSGAPESSWISSTFRERRGFKTRFGTRTLMCGDGFASRRVFKITMRLESAEKNCERQPSTPITDHLYLWRILCNVNRSGIEYKLGQFSFQLPSSVWDAHPAVRLITCL